jgi:hypothetical protein
MSKWNITLSALFILSFVVLVMLLIVVLPDVDLLDTAFHRDTAPVVIHALATGASAALSVTAAFRLPDITGVCRSLRQLRALAAGSDPNFRPIVLRSIRR